MMPGSSFLSAGTFEPVLHVRGSRLLAHRRQVLDRRQVGHAVFGDELDLAAFRGAAGGGLRAPTALATALMRVSDSRRASLAAIIDLSGADEVLRRVGALCPRLNDQLWFEAAMMLPGPFFAAFVAKPLM